MRCWWLKLFSDFIILFSPFRYGWFQRSRKEEEEGDLEEGEVWDSLLCAQKVSGVSHSLVICNHTSSLDPALKSKNFAFLQMMRWRWRKGRRKEERIGWWDGEVDPCELRWGLVLLMSASNRSSRSKDRPLHLKLLESSTFFHFFHFFLLLSSRGSLLSISLRNGRTTSQLG